jgi:predicted peptidase
MLPLIGALAMGMPQEPQAGSFEAKITKTVGYQYLISLPEGYEAGQERFPLIVFLHGSGERGSDVQQVKVHGPLKEIVNGRKIPAIVVAPQCPANRRWEAEILTAMLDHLETKYRVDKDRIYITGLSMGGFGTWDLAAHNAGRLAAIAPVCGGGDVSEAPKLAKLPIWVTHGDADQVVPIGASQEMVDAVKAAGNPRVRFDIIVGGGHDTWTDFYAKDEFYTWLLSQRRRQ